MRSEDYFRFADNPGAVKSVAQGTEEFSDILCENLTGQDAASLGVVGALYGGVIGASAAAGKNFFTVVSKARAARSLYGPRGIGAVAQRTIRA